MAQSWHQISYIQSSTGGPAPVEITTPGHSQNLAINRGKSPANLFTPAPAKNHSSAGGTAGDFMNNSVNLFSKLTKKS